MTIKTITKNRRPWAWPEYDTELIKVFDQVDDLAVILDYVDGSMTCVQAGGACGVWPFYLRQKFGKVYTFEPDPLNYECLEQNLSGVPVECFQAALGTSRDVCHVERVPSEQTNAGAGFIQQGGITPVLAIDDLPLQFCDLIQLDVEGHELHALVGGYLTIRRYKPTIVIEEKPLPQGGDHMAAREFLEQMGYRERERVHRDVIFTC